MSNSNKNGVAPNTEAVDGDGITMLSGAICRSVRKSGINMVLAPVRGTHKAPSMLVKEFRGIKFECRVRISLGLVA